MYFLKELPTEGMIAKYSAEWSGKNSSLISLRLKGLREYSLLLRRLEEYFSSYGLSQLRFLVLMVIDRELNRDGLYAFEIANRLDVSKPVLSRAVKALLEESLLVSTQDEKDARARLLSLTEKSQSLLTDILPGYFEILTHESTQGHI